MGIGFITAFTLPYPISILLGFGAIMIINVTKNRLKLSDNDKDKAIKPKPSLITSLLLFNPTQFHQSTIYVCAKCNNVNNHHLCPRCKSIMKKVL
jgi:predicted RND superfamily exporter protein